ncbi:MAG: hypothetical protein V8S81_03510 [Oscillospiraceae bacterium]
MYQSGVRSEPRILAAVNGQNTLSARKVFFATYTPPQKTDWNLFVPLRRRKHLVKPEKTIYSLMDWLQDSLWSVSVTIRSIFLGSPFGRAVTAGD